MCPATRAAPIPTITSRREPASGTVERYGDLGPSPTPSAPPSPATNRPTILALDDDFRALGFAVEP
jgi:hypothetical protein